MIRHIRDVLARRRGESLQEGFTLIELLIVIVVLGILAAVVIFSLGGVTAQSASAACNADGKTIEIAVAAYDTQTGAFPTTVAQTTPPVTAGAPITDNNTATDAGLVSGYIHTWPSNGTHYSYSLASGTGVLSVTVGGVTTAYDSESATAGCSQAQ
jgi:general secretion pathway protein G